MRRTIRDLPIKYDSRRDPSSLGHYYYYYYFIVPARVTCNNNNNNISLSRRTPSVVLPGSRVLFFFFDDLDESVNYGAPQTSPILLLPLPMRSVFENYTTPSRLGGVQMIFFYIYSLQSLHAPPRPNGPFFFFSYLERRSSVSAKGEVRLSPAARGQVRTSL